MVLSRDFTAVPQVQASPPTATVSLRRRFSSSTSSMVNGLRRAISLKLGGRPPISGSRCAWNTPTPSGSSASLTEVCSAPMSAIITVRARMPMTIPSSVSALRAGRSISVPKAIATLRRKRRNMCPMAQLPWESASTGSRRDAR
jgi:hypothetical protein